MNNTNKNLSIYHIDKLIDSIKYEYYNRIETALRCINFISINEKTKVIKCRNQYSFSSINLYNLNYVAKWETNLNNTSKDCDCIEIIKEYNNLNVEFKFKSNVDYETFKELVFYSNEKTKYIINNATEELKTTFKGKCKKDGENEYYDLIEFVNSSEFSKVKDFHKFPININLIKKCWGI